MTKKIKYFLKSTFAFLWLDFPSNHHIRSPFAKSWPFSSQIIWGQAYEHNWQQSLQHNWRKNANPERLDWLSQTLPKLWHQLCACTWSKTCKHGSRGCSRTKPHSEWVAWHQRLCSDSPAKSCLALSRFSSPMWSSLQKGALACRILLTGKARKRIFVDTMPDAVLSTISKGPKCNLTSLKVH